MHTRRKKKWRITNRRRFSFFCLSLVFLFCCGFSSARGNAAAEREALSVYVKPGDTLWSIAAEYNESNRDVRKLVREIQKLNSMESAMIHVGEEILIPN